MANPLPPFTITCTECQSLVDYRGAFSLWWDWESETWRVTGARCAACAASERGGGAPVASFGMRGAAFGVPQRARHQAGELDVRVSSPVDNVARVRVIMPNGKTTEYAEAVIRRIELRRSGKEGAAQVERPFKLVLWLEASGFLSDPLT